MKLRNKKTGNKYIVGEESHVCTTQSGKIEVRIMTHDGHVSFFYTSFEKMLKEWEVYTPVEPLIKDKKIRKAVRAWAEANDIDGATFYTSSHFWYLRTFNDREQGIDFWLKWDDKPNLIESKYYTIAELCGEEEECES